MRQQHMRLISVPPKHPDKKVTREISSIASPCGDSGLSASSAIETPLTAVEFLLPTRLSRVQLILQEQNVLL